MDKKDIMYVIKDSRGNQLSAPNKDDSELWDRVEAMEARGRTGLCVVAYTGKNECINEAFNEDANEYMFFVEDAVKTAMPNFITRINEMNQEYAFAIDPKKLNDSLADDYRDAVWNLVSVLYRASYEIAPPEDMKESCGKQLTESSSPFDYDILTSEVIENSYLYDNDNFVQAEQKLFDTVNKKLGVKDATIILDNECEFDPYYLEIDTISENSKLTDECDYYVVDAIPMVIEHNQNGSNYMFFRNAEEARNYEQLVREYYNADLDEGVADVVGKVVGGVAKAGASVIDNFLDLHS